MTKLNYYAMSDKEAGRQIKRIIEGSSTDEEARLGLKDQLGIDGVIFRTQRAHHTVCGDTVTMTMCMFMAYGPSGQVITG